MSLTNWSTSAYLTVNSAVITAPPFTISAWIYLNNTPAQVANIICFNASTDNTNRFNLFVNTSSVIAFGASDAGGASNFTGSTLSNGIWYHVAGVAHATNSREIFVNGVSVGTTSTSKSPIALNQTSIGCRRGLTVNNPFENSSYIAEVCIRNTNLSADDLLQVASGHSSLLVKRDSIRAYYRLVNRSVMLRNFLDSYNLSEVGSALTVADHPPIRYPKNHIV